MTSIYEPWRLEYVALDDIKHDFEQRQKDHAWSENDEKQFETTIRLEAEKVEFFINKKQKELDARIAYCERTLNSNASISSQLSLSTTKSIQELWMDLNELAQFTRYNVLALQSLIDMHDHETNLNTRPLFIHLVRSKHLDKQRFDTTLIKIAALQDKIQPLEHGNVTARYWIHPNNVREVKAIILFHHPIAAEDKLHTSVYLDDPHFNLYQQRLQRDESSETIRYSWEGEEKNITLEREIYHHSASETTVERLTMDASKIESFIYGTYTAEQYANDLRAEAAMSERDIQINYKTASDIQTDMMEHTLTPKFRSLCKRTTYADMQLSIDTDIRYFGEEDTALSYDFPYALLEVNSQDIPAWLMQLLTSTLVYEVPRFSVYLHGTAYLFHRQCPLLPWWLSQSETFQQADKTRLPSPLGYLERQLDHLSSFKRAHRTRAPSCRQQTSFISGSTLARTSSVIRPSVYSQENFSQDDFNPRNASTESLIHDSNVTQRKKKKKEEDEKKQVVELDTLYLEDVKDLEAAQPKKKKKKKQKDLKETGATVEPKVFFASERTFIQWLHFACTLMTLALTLLNFGDSINRIVAIVFFCIAFIFSFYSFGFFRYRAFRIRNKPHLRYDDWFGPPMLCILLLTALILNFVLRWRTPAQNTTYLGTGNSSNTDTSSL